MNFLQLCQQVRQEAGIASNGPSTVGSQTGEMKRLVDWVAQAWVEIQEARNDWEWMRQSISFDTVAGQQIYAPSLGMVARWKEDSFRSFRASAGVGTEIFLANCNYTTFRDYYLFGSRQSLTTSPVTVSVMPDKSLILGPIPDDIYTVRGEYYKVPQTLASDTDVPDMPARFHWAIIHKALMKYGSYEAAMEVIQEQSGLYSAMFSRLEAEQAPQITVELGF